MELGGFAETRADIDGTEEEFNAFNFCLAEDYLTAMIEEDFESLGEVGIDTIKNIVYWLNYDGDIGKDKEDIIKSIPRGELITIKGRTLEEATIENDNEFFADVFISNGNKNPELFVIVMDKTQYFSDEKRIPLLNRILFSAKSQEEYISFLKTIFDLIEERYNKKATAAEKRKFLVQIRPYIEGINVPSKQFNKDEIKAFVKKMNYNWQKDMSNK